MLQIVSLVLLMSIYLKLTCYNVIVHKTLAIISWCHSVPATVVVFDCMCNTQKFFVIEPTQRGWRTSKLYRICFVNLVLFVVLKDKVICRLHFYVSPS